MGMIARLSGRIGLQTDDDFRCLDPIVTGCVRGD
jgi:hypothetical protein